VSLATRRVLGIAVLSVTLVVVTSAMAAAPSLTLTPSSVLRGHVVLIKGSAGDCPSGDAAIVISKAFVHTHNFAGLPAVFARVKPGGSFRVRTRIPATKRRGRYQVTARCGGGNLGLLKHLTVR